MLTIVDLFCGIGGVACAATQLRERGIGVRVDHALDIDRRVQSVLADSYQVGLTCKTLESIPVVPSADLWWLSPPCQPYTRRGLGLADADRRSPALGHLLQRLDQQQPACLILENVPQFQDSPHHRRLVCILERHGYQFHGDVICPTQLGIPMRRQRYYLRASRVHARLRPIVCEPGSTRGRLKDYLCDGSEIADQWDQLQVGSTMRQRYRAAMDTVDPADPGCVAACFTSAYGRSPVRAGSYLSMTDGQVRRFAPLEIQALMGFGAQLRWSPEHSLLVQYHLLGNALSVDVVRLLLESLV